MDVLAAIKARRSIRSYHAKDMEEEKLRQVLEAGRLAPSANNRQDWKIIVVKEANIKNRLMEAASGQPSVGAAPVVLVACGTDTDRLMLNGQATYNIDISIALSFMILEATELGLGTCWLGHYDEPEVKQLLGIPDQMRVVAMTPLGYPAEDPDPRPRMTLEQFASYEKF